MKKLILSTLIIVLFSSFAFSTTEDERKTLAGLEGVLVTIEPLDGTHGITNQQLQTDVELRLRQSGIKVLSEEEWLQTTGNQYLYLKVNINMAESYFAASINLLLVQQVFLARNQMPTLATTWDVDCVVKGGLKNISSIRGFVKDAVDIFCNDYLAANPKEQPKDKPKQ